MIRFLKTAGYLIIIPTILWFVCVAYMFLIAFSYENTIVSKILYIILGGWVPGKLYGLNLIHAIIGIVIIFFLINIVDWILKIGPKSRKTILVIVAIFFLYEAIFNFFFRTDNILPDDSLKQGAIIQLIFVIGIAIKAFNPDADLDPN